MIRQVIVLSLLILFFENFGLQKNDYLCFVSFLNVGQGDAIYIRSDKGFDILIDGGPDNSVVYELGRVMPFWDRKIDLVLLTHTDSDHLSGLISVIEKYEIGQLVINDFVAKTAEYNEWMKRIEMYQIPVVKISEDMKFVLDNEIRFSLFYFAFQDNETKSNNTSILSRLDTPQLSFLFTGDIEKEVEMKITDSNKNIDVDVLKVGHHGSKTSTTQGFFEKVSPQYAVIQVAHDNSFGHPHYSTLHRLYNYDTQVLRNDVEGRITFYIDRDNFSVKKNEHQIDAR